jgi:MSHA biogenesis protein MshI
VGPHGLVAVRVSVPARADDRPQVQASAFFPSGAESDWPDGMRKLARDLSGNGLDTVVVPHAQLVSLMQLSIPPTPESERIGALKFRAREVSQVPIEDMLLDYVDVAGTRARGGEPPCYCAIASRERMTRLRDAALGAGFHLEAIDVADMALSHVLGRAAGEGEAVSALVLGNQGLRFVIVNEGKLSLFRSSTLTAEHFRNGFAEHLDQLLLEVQRTIDFYESHYTTPPPKRLLLMPDWPFTEALAEALTPALRVRPEPFSLDEVLQSTDRLGSPAPDLMVLAVGAALRPKAGVSA